MKILQIYKSRNLVGIFNFLRSGSKLRIYKSRNLVGIFNVKLLKVHI